MCKGPKTSIAKYIRERCKLATGCTVKTALTKTVTNNKGVAVRYKQSDLAYDIRRQFLAIRKYSTNTTGRNTGIKRPPSAKTDKVEKTMKTTARTRDGIGIGITKTTSTEKVIKGQKRQRQLTYREAQEQTKTKKLCTRRTDPIDLCDSDNDSTAETENPILVKRKTREQTGTTNKGRLDQTQQLLKEECRHKWKRRKE